MIRHEGPRSSRRRLPDRTILVAVINRALAVALVVAALSIVPGHPGSGHEITTLAGVDSGEAAGSATDDRGERDTILELVREHRRAIDEPSLRHLADTIYAESVDAAVDPLLIAAIVAKESSFDSAVVSHAGAVGLMQLRPFVARDVADRLELEWAGRQTLNSPTLNLRLGIHYYKALVERFEGDADKALTAYNRGPTRVRSELRAGTYSGSRYAREVLRLYRSLSSATRSRA